MKDCFLGDCTNRQRARISRELVTKEARVGVQIDWQWSFW